jgi:hypothetical protein
LFRLLLARVVVLPAETVAQRLEQLADSRVPAASVKMPAVLPVTIGLAAGRLLLHSSALVKQDSTTQA